MTLLRLVPTWLWVVLVALVSIGYLSWRLDTAFSHPQIKT